jgi:hypothetical protein
MISGGSYGSAALGGTVAPPRAVIPIERSGRPGIVLTTRTSNSGDEPLELRSAW